MSVLKGILHHWNKTNRNYDTIHPETEVAQVTDWNQGIVNTLASTALGGLVNTLTSDSLLTKMIQKVLEATGVKYSLGQNGYVCFGSLVGGLIIQWGKAAIAGATGSWVNYPIAFKELAIPIIAHYNDLNNIVATCMEVTSTKVLYIKTYSPEGRDLNTDVLYIVIGI